MARDQRKEPNPFLFYLILGLINWALIVAVIAFAKPPVYTYLIIGVVTLGIAGLWYWVMRASAAGKAIGPRLAVVIILSAAAFLSLAMTPLIFR